MLGFMLGFMLRQKLSLGPSYLKLQCFCGVEGRVAIEGGWQKSILVRLRYALSMDFLEVREAEWSAVKLAIVLEGLFGVRLSVGELTSRIMLILSSSQGVKSHSLLIFVIGIIYLQPDNRKEKYIKEFSQGQIDTQKDRIKGFSKITTGLQQVVPSKIRSKRQILQQQAIILLSYKYKDQYAFEHFLRGQDCLYIIILVIWELQTEWRIGIPYIIDDRQPVKTSRQSLNLVECSLKHYLHIFLPPTMHEQLSIASFMVVDFPKCHQQPTCVQRINHTQHFIFHSILVIVIMQWDDEYKTDIFDFLK